MVGLRVLYVYLLMRYVHVSAHYHGLTLIQFVQISLKIIFPFHAVSKSAQLILRVRCIDGDEIEVGIFERDDPSFLVMLLYTDAQGHAHGLVFGEDCRAAIAFFLGIIPVAFVSVEGYRQLSFLHFCFLQAEEVGIKLLKTLLKVLAHARP